jgi:hypothetical protein
LFAPMRKEFEKLNGKDALELLKAFFVDKSKRINLVELSEYVNKYIFAVNSDQADKFVQFFNQNNSYGIQLLPQGELLRGKEKHYCVATFEYENVYLTELAVHPTVLEAFQECTKNERIEAFNNNEFKEAGFFIPRPQDNELGLLELTFNYGQQMNEIYSLARRNWTSAVSKFQLGFPTAEHLMACKSKEEFKSQIGKINGTQIVGNQIQWDFVNVDISSDPQKPQPITLELATLLILSKETHLWGADTYVVKPYSICYGISGLLDNQEIG